MNNAMSLEHFTIDRFTPERLEGQCRGWDTLPQPGDFVELLTEGGSRFYTRIESIHVLDSGDSLYLEMTPVEGAPDPRIKSAQLLSQTTFFQHKNQNTK